MSTERRSLLATAMVAERKGLLRALLAGGLVNLSTLGLAATSAWLIVRAAQRPVVLSLTVPMGLVQLFALAKAAGRYVERTQTHSAALGVMGRVRANVARTLEPLLPAGLGPRSAEAVDVALSDVGRVEDLLTSLVGPLATGVAASLVALLVSALVVPASALSLLVGLVVVAGLVPAVATRAGARAEAALDQVRAELVEFFDAMVQSRDEYVMGLGEDGLRARLFALEERVDHALHRRNVARAIVLSIAMLTGAAATLAALYLSARALREGRLSASLLAVPALLGAATMEMVGALAPELVHLGGDVASLARLESFATRPPPVQEPADHDALASDSRIELHDVARRFGATTVLAGLDLSLQPGDVVVLGGRSGAGKTTLAHLMAKMLDPSQGSLRLGGVDYARLESAQVRTRVGLAEDEPYVFATSLARNLRLARPSASDEELCGVLELVGLGPWSKGLAGGLDYELGGPGGGLSGGERRRIGVARELLAARVVGVFDEPTEGLDAANAALVRAAIAARYADGAVLVITHREADYEMGTVRVELVGGRLRDVE